MAYSVPSTKAVGDTLTAADWNSYVRDNAIDLAARLSAISYIVQGAEFTTTSTSYVDMTGLTTNLTITRQSTILMIVSGNAKIDTALYSVVFKGVINGVSDSKEVSSQFEGYVPLSYIYAKTGMTAGTYTVKLQMRTTNATITARGASINMFVVWIPEV